MNAKTVTRYRESLKAMSSYIGQPDKGYPFAYGGASQIAELAVNDLEVALAEIARLESALRSIGLYEGDAPYLGSHELCQIIAHLGEKARAAVGYQPRPIDGPIKSPPRNP